MKHLFIALLSFTFTRAFSQTQNKMVTHYLQLTAGVYQDDISLNTVRQPKQQAGYNDTCINYVAINNVLRNFHSPMLAFNLLGKDGWSLVSTTTLSESKFSTLLIVYYLKKDFEH